MNQQTQTHTTLRTLFPEPGQVVELCCLPPRVDGKPKGRQTGGFFGTDDKGLEAMAAHATAADLDGYNVYFGLNPRLPTELPRADHTLVPGVRAKDTTVARRTWLLVDADPVRAPGHKDDASSAEERAAAKRVMAEAVTWLSGEGWPTPAIMASSGNGYHALYRIDLEPESTLVHACLLALSARFSTPAVKLDTALGDPSRICRLYGTTNRKGLPTPERPHRPSKVLVAPPDAQTVPPGKLVALAGLATPAGHGKPTNGKPKATAKSKAKTPREWALEQQTAVKGDYASKALMRVAHGLVRDWGLPRDEARQHFAEYVATCPDDYTDAELEHCLDSAEKALEGEPPERVGWRQRGAGKSDKSRTDYDVLVELGRGLELWTTPNGEPFATVEIDGVQHHLATAEQAFGDWLLGAFLYCHGRVPKTDTINSAKDSIGALARLTQTRHEAYVRVGWEDGAIYIDLADDTRRAVKISATGWEVRANPPCRFRRSALLAPLPEPKRDPAALAKLRALVNVDDADWPALLAFLVGCYMPPPAMFPILVPHGPRGAGKSTICGQALMLVDPRTDSPKAGVPINGDDLMIVAEKSWLQRFDNVANINQRQSDLLCTLVSGSSLAARTLYSNKDLTVITARRPIMINGISVAPEAADLLSRCLPIGIVAPAHSRTDDELAAELLTIRPGVLGALYDALSVALRDYTSTTIADPPRLHDLARWAVAAESALGLSAGAVMEALGRTRREASEAAVEASPLPAVIRAVLAAQPKQEMEATATDWLKTMNDAEPLARHNKKWPRDGSAFGRQLAVLAPELPAAGLVAEQRRSHGKRAWFVRTLVPGAGCRKEEQTGAD